MAWNVELTSTAEKQLKKLDPWSREKGLVSDCRILCQILDAEVVTLAVTFRHRKDVYGD